VPAKLDLETLGSLPPGDPGNAKGRYESQFTRFWARILVAVGLALASRGVFLAAVALVIDMPWGKLTGHAVVEVTLVAIFLAGLFVGLGLLLGSAVK
jgi:hypothetical protein